MNADTRPGTRPGEGPRLRPVQAADLPRLRPWLAPGAACERPPAGQDDEQWWLLADEAGTAPLACARLRRAIGLQLPRYWYHRGCVVHAAAELGLFHRLHTLQLGNDLTGASELADIAWDRHQPMPAQAAALRALLQAVLAQVATQQPRYAELLIVELPGPRDAQGQAPFWHGLGRFFYDGDPLAAAQRFGPAWRSHVAALMPRQPVYTAFLGPAAQAAIGQVAPEARVLAEALHAAGLRPGRHIAIDDGGPVWEVAVDALPAGPAGVRAAP